MRAESLREMLHALPFQPFTVHVVSGASYLIDHPEVAWLTRGGRTLYVSLAEGEGERVFILDTALIERLEPNGAQRPD
jgi:hypothetical protein